MDLEKSGITWVDSRPLTLLLFDCVQTGDREWSSFSREGWSGRTINDNAWGGGGCGDSGRGRWAVEVEEINWHWHKEGSIKGGKRDWGTKVDTCDQGISNFIIKNSPETNDIMINGGTQQHRDKWQRKNILYDKIKFNCNSVFIPMIMSHVNGSIIVKKNQNSKKARIRT